MNTLNQARAQALEALRSAGYGCYRHPSWDDCVVAIDPVYVSWGGGGTRTDNKYVTLRTTGRAVARFIDSRN